MASSGRTLVLTSSDGVAFEVEEAVALQSQTIKNMKGEDCAGKCIPVTSNILSRVTEYCKKHVEANSSPDDVDLKNWDADFVKINQAALFDIIEAASYLGIKGLVDLTGWTVADMIKGKTPEEIRKIFNIKNDFTPEEEEEIRREKGYLE